MKSRKIEVAFRAENIGAAEALICDAFFDCGVKGVICQTPLCQTPLEKEDVLPTDFLDETADPGIDTTAVVGYLADGSGTEDLIDQIRSRLQNLESLNIHTRIRMETVDDEDWAHAWKEHFHVTRITDHIVIRPSWKLQAPGIW